MNKAGSDEKVMAELYDRLSSEYYDYHAKRGDIEFFKGYALESGGPVLELGCGTGRVSIPIARAGVNITGLDLSAEMLSLCRKKLVKEPDEVRSRIKLARADMRDFSLDATFALAVITYGPFNNLLTVADQLACLGCIHRHLKKGGRLVFDVIFLGPEELSMKTPAVIVKDRPPFLMPDGRKVSWGLRFEKIDCYNQVIHETLTYDVAYPDGRRERLAYPEETRFFYRLEVEHLLARAGFKPEAVYADFNKTPFGEKPPEEMIIAAVKE